MRFLNTTIRAAFIGLATAITLVFGTGSTLAQHSPGVTDKEIKFGAWMPLTGPIAIYGVPQRAGVEAYLNMINDRGGIKGRKITISIDDNAFNPQRTVAAARKLITRDEVLAIVVPNGTAQSAAAFDYVLGEAKVPLLNVYGGSADWYSPPRANLYGALAPLENQARTIGRWAAKDGHKNVLVVHSTIAAWETVAKMIEPAMKSVRSDVSVELYPTKFDTADYSPIALDIARKKPDAVILILAQGEIIRITKEFAAQGFKSEYYTWTPSVANSLLELGGPVVNGIKSVSWTLPVIADTPAIKEYRDALAKYFPGEKPDYVSLTSFGLTKIVVEAVRRIDGPVTREALLRSMESLKNYDTGIIPPVTFGPDRHLGGTILQRVVVQAGRWVGVGAPVDSEKDW